MSLKLNLNLIANIENDVATLSLENKPTNDAEDKKKAKGAIL